MACMRTSTKPSRFIHLLYIGTDDKIIPFLIKETGKIFRIIVPVFLTTKRFTSFSFLNVLQVKLMMSKTILGFKIMKLTRITNLNRASYLYRITLSFKQNSMIACIVFRKAKMLMPENSLCLNLKPNVINTVIKSSTQEKASPWLKLITAKMNMELSQAKLHKNILILLIRMIKFSNTIQIQTPLK